jgi:hypothetical protein
MDSHIQTLCTYKPSCPTQDLNDLFLKSPLSWDCEVWGLKFEYHSELESNFENALDCDLGAHSGLIGEE